MTSRLLALLGLVSLAAVAQPRVIPIPNGDFEQKQESWAISEQPAMSTITDERAASGTYSLKIVDNDEKQGSSVTSLRVPYKGIGELAIRGKAWPVDGSGLGIYVRQYDAQGNALTADPHIGAIGGRENKWIDFMRPFYTLPECASVDVWFHSYSHARVEAYIDDLEFVVLATEIKPPWEGSYKLTKKDKLTAADVLGPDGIVYPNWTRTGVDGGIPEVKVVANLADFGAKPDDGKDDSAALAAACEKVGSAGGGAILIGPGTYHLDHPVNTSHSGVVIRGSGRDRTNLIFRYDLPESGLAFYGLAADRTVAPTDLIEAHALPKGLQRLRLYAGDVQLRDWRRGQHSGNSFRVGVSMRDLFGKVTGDSTELRIEAEYAGQPTRKLAVPVRLLRDVQRPAAPSPQAALYFIGNYGGNRIKLAKDGTRGSVWLDLESTEGLSRGDKILVDGPATKRWKELTRNACLWGNYRRYSVRVVEVQGNRIRIEQPLRLDFPTVDGSYVQRLAPIEWCGVEDLTIEQTANLWINTVEFRLGWNCWAKGVRVRMTGRFPIHTSMGKWCEVRDSVFEDAWFKGGGGTAYLGWQDSWDCLMDNVECSDYRHAPLVQWAAAGNVIRNGVFHRSDAQWHSGWTNENLFENCVIDSVRGNGGYGFGMWASPPEDTAHGPNGPRNVIYNCDTTSEKDGLWMGGMNENWLVLYNRFVVKSGRGVFAKTASFDHVVRGNTFVMQDGKSPAVLFATPDCAGGELVDNTVYGKSVYVGACDLEVDRGNRLLPLTDTLPKRQEPPVPSIYDWQKKNVPVKRELPIR